jgi:Ser/Thr protein kinase RdoA (MazF antagonist)
VLPQLVDDDRMASAVGYFLREDAAAALRPRMLALLADAAERTDLWHDRNDRIATSLAETLEKLFSQGDAVVRTSAFTKLLRHLASRQIPLAVELLNRLGRA